MTECYCGWKGGELTHVCSAHADLIAENKRAFIAGYKHGYESRNFNSYPEAGYRQWQEMLRKGNNTL